MKIPKVLFQTSILKPAAYLVERIQSTSPGWEYKHFSDSDIVQFLTENPLDEFTNSLAVFHSFKNGAHKSDFFRYYYLYVKGGVYIDSDALLENGWDSILEDYSMITVKSGLNKIEKSIFNGFICAAPNNIIIYQALKDIYHIDNEKLNKDYFLICKNLYNIIDSYNKIFEEVMGSQRKNELDLYRLISQDDGFKHAMQDTIKRMLRI
jgi:mannosyltransferase OCH1-like enzyme